MIVTVTMNPAVDRTVSIESLHRGGLNRIQKAESDAGGKGINVSKTLKVLGADSTATGFLAGTAGKKIEEQLKIQGIQTDFLWIKGETRTNTKVQEIGGCVTEFNEPGPEVSEEDRNKLLEKLEDYAGENVLFVLAGSLPRGVPDGFYGEIIRRVHKKGAKVLLDADGERFRSGCEAGPEIVKPNREELLEYAGIARSVSMTKEEESQIIGKTVRDLFEKGVKRIVVSMGKEGALMRERGFAAAAEAIPVEVQSTVGAGDAFAAALAYAWENKLDKKEAFQLGMAVSAGAVTTEGTRPPSLKKVQELLESLKRAKQ